MSDSDEATKHDKPPHPSDVGGPPDFGARYRVLGTLGKGGMGEVFRAYDTELKREVALKVVRGDADHEASLARFRREIALAHKVTSPNVLRVYDLAEHAGLRFLSMEFVDGDDLGKLLKREKRLSLERALAIFRQVCAGLAAAHAQGVVHRDLKPQNVLVDKEGHVRVADFGLARSIGDSALTASGAILGSPAYMSPEQVKGDPTDERSDIYSLGIMLYQLVTGETPFQAPTPHAVMEMRLHKKPRPLRDVAPDAPAYLEGICAKCLALNPSARYASMKELLAAYDAAAPAAAAPRARKRRWLVPAIAAGGLVAAATIAYVAWPRHAVTPSKPVAAPVATTGPTTVLVLGIDNRSGDPALDNTVDAIVHSALRRSERVDPITGGDLRRLAATFGSDIAVDDHLGELLAARQGRPVLVVHGTISAKGNRFSLALSAKNVTTGSTAYEQTLDAASLDDVVTVAARQASGLRSALGEKISDEERERTGLSRSLDADHEYALGILAMRGGDYSGAVDHLGRSIAIDSKFAIARMALSVALNNLKRASEASRELQLALESVDQMGERDRLKTLGDYYQYTTEDYSRAITQYEQLLAKWPTDIGAETNVSNAYQSKNDLKMAVELAKRASKDHPMNPIIRANASAVEIAAAEIERAVEDGRKTLADLPRPTPSVYEYLAIGEQLLGHREKALEALGDYERGDASTAAAVRADIAMYEGRFREAATLLQKGIDADVAAHIPDGAEIKLAMLAELRARSGDKAGARAAAARVTTQPPRMFAAALVFATIGDDKAASEIAARFAREPTPSRRAMAKLIEGESLRLHGKASDAIVRIQEGLQLLDTPYGHYLLGRAELDAKRYAEAYTELTQCIARRGQAANGVDDVTMLRYLPLFTYYLAKAQEGLNSPDAAKSYAAFLAMMHDPDPTDPLVADARKHVQ
jgi:tetratricopeptide (TPR) repeat protein/predicted Ser/Thr protein kinase